MSGYNAACRSLTSQRWYMPSYKADHVAIGGRPKGVTGSSPVHGKRWKVAHGKWQMAGGNFGDGKMGTEQMANGK